MAYKSGELGLLDRVTLKSDVVGVEVVLYKLTLYVWFVVSESKGIKNLVNTASAIV